jgi:DNA-directed RNA polymerase specialized sigma24 family protein
MEIFMHHPLMLLRPTWLLLCDQRLTEFRAALHGLLHPGLCAIQMGRTMRMAVNTNGEDTSGAPTADALSARTQQYKAQAVAWARQLQVGGRAADVATAEALHGSLGRWLEKQAHFRHGVHVDEAEDIRAEVVFQFHNQPPRDPATAFGWLCRMLQSRCLDWHDRRNAKKRGDGVSPVSLDLEPSEEGGMSADAMGAVHDTRERDALLQCIARMLDLFTRISPQYGALLRMAADGLENEDMAIVVYELEPERVGKTDLNRLKSMLSTARKEALPYLGRCHPNAH